MSPLRPPRTPEFPDGDGSMTSDQPPLRSISSLSDASCLSDDATASYSSGELSCRGGAGAEALWSEPAEATAARILRVAEVLRTSASDACGVDKSKSVARSRNFSVAYWLLAGVAVILAQGFHRLIPDRPTSPPTDCVYVPGGGFSGFWFTLGRLRSIPSEARLDRDYYCYSAGCLAVVATALLDRDMEQMYDMARDVQQRWKIGRIGRYSVVRAFLDDVLDGLDSKNLTKSDDSRLIDEQALSRIHIITTGQNGYWGARTEIRSAATVAELHEMLLQTTWIPYATGDGLWRNGHMDGAFSAPFHPTCRDNVGLALHPWLLANVVNVNLPRESVEKFWNLGLEYGLH